MTELVAGLLLIPPIDWAIKAVLHRWLGSSAKTLGPIGRLQLVRAPMWLVRHRLPPRLGLVWMVWSLSAVAVAATAWCLPSCGLLAGLLLGGSLSHALETSIHGAVADYIVLGTWPAFDLADVAITVGGVGTAAGVVMGLLESLG